MSVCVCLCICSVRVFVGAKMNFFNILFYYSMLAKVPDLSGRLEYVTYDRAFGVVN